MWSRDEGRPALRPRRKMAGFRWRHFGTGRKTKARGLPQIHSHLGMLSAQLGDKEAARQALSIAAAAPMPFPGQDEAKTALAALK